MHYEIASVAMLLRNDIMTQPLMGEGMGEGELKVTVFVYIVVLAR